MAEKMKQTKLHRELPTLASEIRALVGEDGKSPPVESWHPERQGEIDIAIDRQGKWYFQGEEMVRMPVVRLLSSVLRKEDGEYFLVTPVEKMKISVEDVPFMIPMVDVESSGITQNIHFTTQMGDCFTLSKDHPLEFVKGQGGAPIPYVMVRSGMKGRLVRTVYYELAGLACESPDTLGRLGIWSAGGFYTFPET